MGKNIHEVWVFVEQRSGKAADVSFELLSKGRKLAENLKGELKAVVIGHNMQNVAEETFRFGANEALLVDHPSLKNYNTLPYSRALSELIDKHQPRIVLFGATLLNTAYFQLIHNHHNQHHNSDYSNQVNN